MVKRFIDRVLAFDDKDQVRDYFTRLTGLFRNLNYAPYESEEYRDYIGQIDELGAEFLPAATA